MPSPLHCERDASGKCIKVKLCYGDYRSGESECLAPAEQRAWSSPIYLYHPAARHAWLKRTAGPVARPRAARDRRVGGTRGRAVGRTRSARFRVPGRDAIATVDGVEVSRADFDRALGALAADKRTPLTNADARRALDRLIDEELLVQRGLDFGLGTLDLAVRKAVVDAMVQFAAAETAGRQPDDDELRAFYAGRPGLVRTARRCACVSSAFRRATQASVEAMREALRAGKDFDVAARSAGGEVVIVPDMLLPARKLGDYAGPSVRDAAVALKPW